MPAPTRSLTPDDVRHFVDERVFTPGWDAKVGIELDAREVRDAPAAVAAVAAMKAAGALAVVADLPADWVLELARADAAPSAPLLFNISLAGDELRGAACNARVFHVAPSERMLSDALAQYLASSQWRKVLVLQGPEAADQRLGRSFEQSAAKFGIKLVATRPFKLSNDPRERDLANVRLLTGNADYDAVVVHDAEGEFARNVPYRTVLPRPVVGSNGLTPLAWHPHLDRYGAPQLNKRFIRAAGRPMLGQDWSAWAAVKAIVGALANLPDASHVDVPQLRAALRDPQLIVDGFKGRRMSFRPWDQQLRQPIVLGWGDYFVGLAPFDGFLHQHETLDTLGIDVAESACKLGK